MEASIAHGSPIALLQQAFDMLERALALLPWSWWSSSLHHQEYFSKIHRSFDIVELSLEAGMSPR
jgi:hypothetical protein